MAPQIIRGFHTLVFLLSCLTIVAHSFYSLHCNVRLKFTRIEKHLWQFSSIYLSKISCQKCFLVCVDLCRTWQLRECVCAVIVEHAKEFEKIKLNLIQLVLIHSCIFLTVDIFFYFTFLLPGIRFRK